VRELVLVAAGGAAGAALRYLMYRLPALGGIPGGTLSVNVLGCFLLPFLAGGNEHLLVTGLAGSLTTYSTLAYESFRLAEQGSHAGFLLNLLLNLSLSAGAFLLGSLLSGGMI